MKPSEPIKEIEVLAPADRHTEGGVTLFEPFGGETECLAWLWQTLYAPDGARAICKQCRTLRRFHRVGGRRAYACDSCGHHVYPTAGTFMANSRLSIATWFNAAMLVRPIGETVTARALAAALSVNYKTALRVKDSILAAVAGGGPDSDLLERLWTDAGTRRDAHGADDSAVRSRPPKAREAIRAAAGRAFAKHGLPGTRISDIAREAGVSSAVVRYHYRSKEDILLAALQWSLEQTHQLVDQLRNETSDYAERFRGVIDLSLPAEGRLQDEMWLEIWARIRFHPELLPSTAALADFWLSFVQETIEDGVRAGGFHPVVPPDTLAQWYVAFADGLRFRLATGYAGIDSASMAEVLVDFAARQLGVSAEELMG